nr:DUF975 family protein [Weissella uvarum]
MAVRYLIMLVGFFFFIIPGIYFALSFALAPFLYASDVQNQREIKSVTAYLRASANLMRGYRMQLLWLNISFIGWWFLVSVTEGLASLYVVPYYQSTMAEFFIARSDEFEKSLS